MTKHKNTNITWHKPIISRLNRERRNGHSGAVIWITGLPSSGKSSVAYELERRLFGIGCNVYVLDGDNIRHRLNKDLGFTPKDRKENIRRIGEVAKLFAEAGIIVITAFISPYQEDRDQARSLNELENFYVVFCKCSLDECERRDPKGLYKRARKGEIAAFTGISAPYEEPGNAEIVVETDKYNLEECAEKILKYLKQREVICRD